MRQDQQIESRSFTEATPNANLIGSQHGASDVSAVLKHQ